MGPETTDFAAGTARKSLTLAAGEYLFRRGQRCIKMYQVQSGTILLERPSLTGATIAMHRAGAGEWVAESSLFSETYHCNAIAEGATALSAVRKTDLLQSFENDPKRSLMFAKMLAARLREMRSLHEITRIRRADERILSWLELSMPERSSHLRLAHSWSRVAEELGLTREALYRSLARLRKAGSISVDDNVVRLHAAAGRKAGR